MAELVRLITSLKRLLNPALEEYTITTSSVLQDTLKKSVNNTFDQLLAEPKYKSEVNDKYKGVPVLFKVADDPEMLKIMLKYIDGATLLATNYNGNTILHICSRKCFDILMDAIQFCDKSREKFDFNAKNKIGTPILHRLLSENFPPKAIERFLSSNATKIIDILDANGQNALFHCKSLEAVNLLFRYNITIKRDFAGKDAHIGVEENAGCFGPLNPAISRMIVAHEDNIN